MISVITVQLLHYFKQEFDAFKQYELVVFFLNKLIALVIQENKK